MRGSTNLSSRHSVRAVLTGTNILTDQRDENFIAHANWTAANVELRGYELARIGLH